MKDTESKRKRNTEATESPSWPLIGMDLDETAAALRVSRRVVQDALAAGELPGRKIGNRWRVSPDALNAYLAGFEHKKDIDDATQADAVSVSEKGKKGRKKA